MQPGTHTAECKQAWAPPLIPGGPLTVVEKLTLFATYALVWMPHDTSIYTSFSFGKVNVDPALDTLS